MAGVGLGKQHRGIKVLGPAHVEVIGVASLSVEQDAGSQPLQGERSDARLQGVEGREGEGRRDDEGGRSGHRGVGAGLGPVCGKGNEANSIYYTAWYTWNGTATA